MTLRVVTLQTDLGCFDEPLCWPDHDVRASLPYGVDFGAYLDDVARQLGAGPGSVVIASALALDDDAPGLAVQPATTDGHVVTVEIAGGIAGTVASVGIVATLSDGFVLPPVRISLQVVDLMVGLLPVVQGTIVPPIAGADLIAGAILSGHRALQASALGRLVYADPTQPDSYAFVGISVGAAVTGAPVQVAGPGSDVIEPSWNWLPGRGVFVGPTGTLTQIPPVAGISHQVGIAVTATSLLVQPFSPIRLS